MWEKRLAGDVRWWVQVTGGVSDVGKGLRYISSIAEWINWIPQGTTAFTFWKKLFSDLIPRSEAILKASKVGLYFYCNMGGQTKSFKKKKRFIVKEEITLVRPPNSSFCIALPVYFALPIITWPYIAVACQLSLKTNHFWSLCCVAPLPT